MSKIGKWFSGLPDRWHRCHVQLPHERLAQHDIRMGYHKAAQRIKEASLRQQQDIQNGKMENMKSLELAMQHLREIMQTSDSLLERQRAEYALGEMASADDLGEESVEDMG